MATTVTAAEIRNIQTRQSGSGARLVGRTLFNRADYNPNLQGQAGILVYERMRRDPEIASALMRRKIPLRAASWSFEPPKQGSKKAIDTMMELCNRYILGEGREHPRDTWKGGLLPQIQLMYEFGVSAIEKIWGVNEKGQQVYARLCPIGPQTISDFELDDLGNVARLKQYAYVMDAKGTSSFKYATIPDPKLEADATAEEKLAIFTYRLEGDNHFGRPLLFELYQAWFHKYELWLLDAIQKELHGCGTTTVQIPEVITDTGSPQYIAALEYISGLRGNERLGGVIGRDWNVKREFPQGTPPDILGSQEYCDTQIARAMGVEESHLGNAPNGSKSMSQSKTSNLLRLSQSDADMIEEQVNTQLVPILCRRNVGPQPEWPRFQCEHLDKMTGSDQADALEKLKDFVRPDRVLEEHIRENNHLPPIDDATREDYKPALPPQITTTNPDGSGGAPSNPDGARGEPPKKSAAKSDGPAPAQSLRRDLLPHEIHTDFAAIQGYLNQEPARVWHRVVQPFRDQMIQRVAEAAAAATDTALSRGQLFGAEERRPLEKRLADELLAALLKVYGTGRGDVRAELARGTVAGKADQGDDSGDDAPTASQASWIKRLAEGFVAMQYLALIGAATRAALTGRQADLPKAEVERRTMLALHDLSEPVVQADLAGVINRTYINGRNDQAKTQAEDVATCYYAAVMDVPNTCGPCEAMDGEEIALDDVDRLIPNPNCDGGDRCRCIPIYVSREAAAQEAA